jgi:hypothetical protein
VNCTKVSKQGFSILVCELQEDEAYMYGGCKRVNHICTQVAMGTVTYT